MEAVFKNLQKCKQAGLLDMRMINGLGQEFMFNFKKPAAAEALFRANTLLYPKVARVFGSYAEALTANGKLKESVKCYREAIELARAEKDPIYKRYEEQIKQLKVRMEKSGK